ncbi:MULTISPECIES: effector-associated constant component EACC1 [unclassified Saccharothrix]|uniref:effector-associated constant component EACC1 n=1 Tax=unclassified Saccharothrix TaxID=2593673 RepID=UPI00307E66D4
MEDERVVLLVVEPDPDVDPDSADRLARRLRAEVAQLDVDARLAADGPVPEGAKGVDAVTLGAVVVALSAAGGVFPLVIETVRDWLARQGARHRVSVTIDGDTIALERASADERQALVDAYVRRHSG